MNKASLSCISLILLLSFILLSCSSENTAKVTGGGGIEGEATVIEGVVQDSEGDAVKDASVKLVNLSEWHSNIFYDEDPVFDSILSNKEGYYRFKVNAPGRYNVIAETDSLMALRTSTLAETTQNRDTITLKRPGFLSGTIKNEIREDSRIRIFGTHYKAMITGSGTYSFRRLPEGNFLMVGQYRVNSSNTLSLIRNFSLVRGEDLTMDSIEIPYNRLLIDDFQGSLPLSAAGRITGGVWYSFSDNYEGGLSSAAITTLSDENPDRDRYLEISVTLKNGTEFPYGGAGCFFSNSYCDISTMNAISFSAKGSGIVRIEFTDSLSDISGVINRFGYKIQLTEDWKDYNIPADSLKLEPYAEEDSIEWAEVSRSIKSLQFTYQPYFGNPTDSTYTMCVDDIEVEGLSIQDITPN